jgi:hypothetical protein
MFFGMFRRSCMFGLMIVATLAATAGGADAGAAAASPEKCLSALLKAMEAGDTAAAAAVVTGDQKQQEWMAAQVAQFGATRRLRAALEKRFGEAMEKEEVGRSLRDRIQQAADEQLHDDLARAKPAAPHDDRVLLVVDEGSPDELQPRLLRVNGEWKLDLGSLSEYMGPEDTPILRAVAKAAEKLVRKVTQGGFKTLQEASDAIDQQLSAAEDSGDKAQPTSPQNRKRS